MMGKDPSERAKSLGLLCTSPTQFVSASSSLHVSQRTDRGRNMLATILARSLHGKYGTTSLKLVSVIKEHSPAEEPFLLWGWHEEDGPVPFVGPNTSRYTNANALSVAKEVNPRRIRCEQNFNSAQIGWRHQNEAEEISSCLIMLKKEPQITPTNEDETWLTILWCSKQWDYIPMNQFGFITISLQSSLVYVCSIRA